MRNAPAQGPGRGRILALSPALAVRVCGTFGHPEDRETTGGLWFQRGTLRHRAEADQIARSAARPRPLCCNDGVDPHLTSLGSVLTRTDERLRAGSDPTRLWPSGFPILDDVLSGGFRAGSLVLLAGPQGLGKTTLALQVARNVAVAGRPVVYFSFEHDPESLLERLIALESGLIADHDSPGLNKIRAAFEATGKGLGGLTERLAGTPAGLASVQRVAS